MSLILYECESKEDQAFMYKIIDFLGLPIYDPKISLKGGYFEDFPCICHSEAGNYFISSKHNETAKYLSTKEFLKYLSEFEPTIQITKKYTATIFSEGIKVGCQLVTWEKYEELEKAVKTFREKA